MSVSKYQAWNITSHLDFTALVLVAQDAGLDVVVYTTQARFLMNCGLLPLIQAASQRQRIDAHKLLHEHEMGELFKVMAFARSLPGFQPMGFAVGDCTQML